jgi:hypothetical protein
MLVVIGASFIALGLANAAAGWTKMNEYRARKHEAIAAGGESVRRPFSGTPSILDPSTDAQLLYEAAAIKYEYYRIVRRGGFYFVAIGAAILAGAGLRDRLRRRRPDEPHPTAYETARKS